jgi:hypothetical protein
MRETSKATEKVRRTMKSMETAWEAVSEPKVKLFQLSSTSFYPELLHLR